MKQSKCRCISCHTNCNWSNLPLRHRALWIFASRIRPLVALCVYQDPNSFNNAFSTCANVLMMIVFVHIRAYLAVYAQILWSAFWHFHLTTYGRKPCASIPRADLRKPWRSTAFAKTRCDPNWSCNSFHFCSNCNLPAYSLLSYTRSYKSKWTDVPHCTWAGDFLALEGDIWQKQAVGISLCPGDILLQLARRTACVERVNAGGVVAMSTSLSLHVGKKVKRGKSDDAIWRAHNPKLRELNVFSFNLPFVVHF